MRIRCPAIRWWVLLLAVGALAAASGCLPSFQPAEPVTITFACDTDERPHYEPLIEAFQKKNRHITVELVQTSQFNIPEADVYAVSPFARRFLIEYEVEVLDLTPYVEQQGRGFERDDFYPGLLAVFQDEEETWALPFTVDVGVMYYNRDLFDRYDVDYPQPDWTWDDFLRAGQALYDPDNGIFGYMPDPYYNDPLAFIYQNGGRIFDDFQNPTRTTFDDPRTVEALEWYAKLMFEQEAAATPYQARQAYGIAGSFQTGIKEGRLGMWSGGLSERGGRLLPEPWDVSWGVVPLPQGQSPGTFSSTVGYVISGQAVAPDACWEWIDFLTRQVPQNGMPARRSVAESEAFADQVGKDVADVASRSIEHAVLFSPAGWDIYGSFQIFNEALEKIYGEEMTPLEAMAWAQERSQYK